VGGRINRKEETYEDSNEPVALVINGLHANFLLELNAKELDTRVKRENIMAWLEGRGSFFAKMAGDEVDGLHVERNPCSGG
jgi:hypothetical protein